MPMPAVTMWKFRADRLRDPDVREEVLRFLRFALVGGLGTVTDVGVLNLLHKAAGFSPVLGECRRVLLRSGPELHAASENYLPQPRAGYRRRQLGLFTAVSMIGLGTEPAGPARPSPVDPGPLDCPAGGPG